jgi:hypothetical protein
MVPQSSVFSLPGFRHRTHSRYGQVAWDTRAFNNPDDWPEDGSQPLYLSNGDQ